MINIRKELYKIIDKHINNLATNGLSIIDACTGYGKSYQIERYIENNINSKKFMFLVPRKNLFLNIKKKYDSKIYLNIPSNYDCFTENFLLIKNEYMIEFENFFEIQDIMMRQKHNKDKKSEGYLKKEFEVVEKEFRNSIKKFINKSLKLKSNDISENKSEILDFFEKQKWIVKLYPSVLLPYADFMQCTIHKSYFRFDTLWNGIHELGNNNDNLFKDYIIFIDEFDSTKIDLLDTIISDNIQNGNLNIYKAIQDIRLAVACIIKDNSRTFYIQKSFYCDDEENIINSYKELFEKINNNYLKYNLNYHIKFNHNDTKGKFLFRDRDVIDVFDDTGKLSVKFNKLQQINEVSVSKISDSLDLYEVTNFILECIEEFVSIIASHSSKYLNYYNNLNDEKLTLKESVISLINELHLEHKKYFENYIYLTATNNYKRNKKEHSFFLNTGFQFFSMMNKKEHSNSTDIQFYQFQVLPEHFIANISRRNIVVGVSATGTIQTYYKNYDSHYLSKILKDKYIEISQEDINLLKKDFIEEPIENLNICILKENNIEQFTEYFKDLEMNYDFKNYAKDFIDIFKKVDSVYKMNRYFKLIDSYIKACKYKIQSFIAFSNAFIANSKDFDFTSLCELLKKISNDYNHEFNVEVLESYDFENKYEMIKKKLKKNENVFLLTTYNTVSLGKNMQYEIVREGKLINIDIQGVYLENLTHVAPQVKKDEVSDLANYLFANQYFRYEQKLSPKEFIDNIKRGFRSYTGLDNSNTSYNDDVKDPIICKTTIQAIGRLCRTSSKKEKCLVILDNNIKDALYRNYEMLVNRMNNRLFNDILEYIIRNTGVPTKIVNEYSVCNDLNRKLTSKKMWYLSLNWWNELKKNDYIEIRNFILYNPTPKIISGCKNEELYCIFQNEIDSYAYHIRKKDNYDLILYNISENVIFNDSFSYQVNVYRSGLSRLMKSNIIKKYFNDKGIPITFEKSNNILNPIAFNVYKGAIGEIAFEAICKSEKIKLYEIDELKHFEKFDYKNGDVYIDVKNWSITHNKDAAKIKEKVIKKAIKVGAKVIIYINILNEYSKDTKRDKISGCEIIEIPWLYDSNTDSYNIAAIDEIRRYIVKYGNKN